MVWLSPLMRIHGDTIHGDGTESTRTRERVRAWVIFAAVLVPALLLGPLFGGRVALLHSHGDEGDHVHVLPRGAVHTGHGVSHAWHERAHGESSAQDHDTPATHPQGIFVAVPDTSAPVVERAPSTPAPALVAAAAGHARAQHVHALVSRPPAAPRPPPPRPRRSAIEALLRSSHALLI